MCRSALRSASLLAFATVLALSAPRKAEAQHVVGGGDPLMVLFTEAKQDAQAMLRRLSGGIPTSVAPEVRDWLMTTTEGHGERSMRYAAMADELAKATLNWREESVGPDKCAAIVMDPAERPAIYLSLPRCRAMLSFSLTPGAVAVKPLIHEAVHRFGVGTSDAEEQFAIDIGIAVFNLWDEARRGMTVRWLDVVPTDSLTARSGATAIWTGGGSDDAVSNQVLIFGGCDARALPGDENCSSYPNAGGRARYVTSGPLGEPPRIDLSRMGAQAGPVGRIYHTAVWTGETKLPVADHKMLIFGGCRGSNGGCGETLAVSGDSMYDPRSDTWLPMSTDGAPSPRVKHTAVFTSDDRMIVWGGLEGYQNPTPDRALGDGGFLAFPEGHPEGVWTDIPAGPDAPRARFGHTATWTGTEMLVFGGCARRSALRCTELLNDGGRFDAETGRWTPIPPAPIRAREFHTAVWTGRYLIVFGGANGVDTLSDGAMFDTVSGVWLPLEGTMPDGEDGRRGHTAFFEPLQGRMIVWGGRGSAHRSRTLVYDVEDRQWSLAGTSADPVGRDGHVAVWARDSLFVWGGYTTAGGFFGRGGAFNP